MGKRKQGDDDMSRKHYIAIAETISSVRAECINSYEGVIAIRRTTEALCQVFKEDNEAFDVQRFLVACGFEYSNAV